MFKYFLTIKEKQVLSEIGPDKLSVLIGQEGSR
jgi:hypothetical protein